MFVTPRAFPIVKNPASIFHGAIDEVDGGIKNNLAKSRPDLVKKAGDIFKDAHQIDAEWPLSGPTKAQKTEAQKAWVIKRKRDKDGWVPPNAKALK
ncbi:hypothetical protein N8651_03725 [Akkermansiaceae bacterium]|nr:hypothetical protein [Akkermansiaceae bacterium]